MSRYKYRPKVEVRLAGMVPEDATLLVELADGQTIGRDGDDAVAVDAAGEGASLESLNGLTAATQTFADVDDTNVTLTIVSADGVHTFTMGWSGLLPISRGGTGAGNLTAAFNALAPTIATGDLIFHNGTNNARLAAGSNGHVLMLSGGVPGWVAPPAAGSSTHVQFNTSGSLSASAHFTWNGTTRTLSIGSSGTSNGILFVSAALEGTSGQVQVQNLDGGVTTIMPHSGASSVTITMPGTTGTLFLNNVSATDRLLGRSSGGAGVIEEITCTSAGRSLLDDADAAAQRTPLGLGVMPLPLAEACVLSADQTGITSTSFIDVTGLSFSVAANKTYRFRFEVIADANAATTGIDLAVNGPASPTRIVYSQWYPRATNVMQYNGAATYDANSANTGSGGTTPVLFVVEGILVNGANAGTLIARIKKENAINGPINVRAGSCGFMYLLN